MMFARFEAGAALGEDFCERNPHVARVYVNWLLRCRREAEAERAARRKRREARWRGIADGTLDGLSTAEADYYAQRDAFLAAATLQDEFREDVLDRVRREPAVGPAHVAEAPEPCVPLREAAERLHVSEATMRQRVWRGRVRGFSLPGHGHGRIVVAVAEIERLEGEALAA
jgi:hypothetical protein